VSASEASLRVRCEWFSTSGQLASPLQCVVLLAAHSAERIGPLTRLHYAGGLKQKLKELTDANLLQAVEYMAGQETTARHNCEISVQVIEEFYGEVRHQKGIIQNHHQPLKGDTTHWRLTDDQYRRHRELQDRAQAQHDRYVTVGQVLLSWLTFITSLHEMVLEESRFRVEDPVAAEVNAPPTPTGDAIDAEEPSVSKPEEKQTTDSPTPSPPVVRLRKGKLRLIEDDD
jgi:hypothetical protein